MVDWQLPEVVGKTSVFSNIAHLTMGAYVFELLGCLEFEWQVLTRKRAFKAPMLLYFYCKWALLAALTGIALLVYLPTSLFLLGVDLF